MFVAHTVFGVGEKVVDGRSAILFATVAGVSLGLLSGGASPTPPGRRGAVRATIAVRAAVLILLGLLLTTLLRPPVAVILDYYGIAFLLLLAPLFLRPLALAVAAVVVAFAAPPLVELIAGAVAFESVADPLQVLARWLIFGEYPVLIWLAFLLAGLVLARADLHDRLTAALALVTGTLCAVVGYASAHLIPGVTAEAHSGTTAEVLGSGGVAIAIVGAFSLLDSATGAGERVARVVRLALAPVAAAGAMPLTIYTAHVIVLVIVRAAVEHNGRWAVPWWLLPALILGSLVFAALWRRFVGAGPLERGLRLLTGLVVRPADRSRVAP